MNNDNACRCEPSDWTPPAGYDGDGSVAAMARRAAAQPLAVHATDPEARYAEQTAHLNCPACGGSGHVDDIATAAARDVLAERRRQVEVEGWTPEHDDAEQERGNLAAAASCYALAAAVAGATTWNVFTTSPPDAWPWASSWWKPGEPRRMLVKSAALALAAIEQIDRNQGGGGGGPRIKV